MVRLDILSDPICPWCLIGKTHLDRALEARPDHPFVVAWHPFQLNPDMPEGGMDRRDYLSHKFGGRERAAEVYARIDAAAREAGIEIDWSAIRRTPNTLDAHRLIHWAGVEHRQGPVVDALFAAYFRQGRDIGDPEVLAAIAGEAGMDAGAVARLLASDADRADVAARDANAREKGVTGVPTFIVGDRHAVSGAQPPDLWERVIDELAGTPQTHPGGTA
ncbi:putative DsbA family dithiol-disulfide isomerase [Hasllibacter halocynthiae]|uniref:Putative DsbA family dithiol-disulfide isomerase n=1 Tax=Hasllibacter halocynthiae TaxID=595589 RepID=A0A2T0X893_9RHOB|nr:DsbA family oxidoreductase [Hasllibacter halocynthiae]PRY95153.1 putative DsbA family dithiol-disulfide isomerase [Hasllibacter halocynthiae]